MFGHVRGAFTDAHEARTGRFELADGGTLFLDEIGNLPLPQQAKLLRVLESGDFEKVGASQTQHVDVRIVCASNADLQAMVVDGLFRKDLYYRLQTVELTIPPLRERRDDILPLAAHFLERHAARYRKAVPALSDEARRALLGYAWPGNVRELEHVIERAVLLARGERLATADLGLGDAPASSAAGADGETLDDVERRHIAATLAACDGRVADAARRLGISRGALYRRLEKHGLAAD
jgi:DNA-binding NtrC family response regulator